MRNILDLSRRFDTNKFVFCWDSKESKRELYFPTYKYKRKEIEKTPEQEIGDDLAYAQFDQLRKKVLPELGFNNVFYQKGYESDDIMSSIVMDEENKSSKIMVTSDEDMFQMLDYCVIYNFSKRETITKDIFMREYGIPPSKWADVKAISGCSTDNVPGVHGVGNSTAIKYILGTLSKKGKIFNRIESRESNEAKLTKMLVKLPFPGTMKFSIEKDEFSLWKYENICKEYGLQSLQNEPSITTWKRTFVDGK